MLVALFLVGHLLCWALPTVPTPRFSWPSVPCSARPSLNDSATASHNSDPTMSQSKPKMKVSRCYDAAGAVTETVDYGSPQMVPGETTASGTTCRSDTTGSGASNHNTGIGGEGSSSGPTQGAMAGLSRQLGALLSNPIASRPRVHALADLMHLQPDHRLRSLDQHGQIIHNSRTVTPLMKGDMVGLLSLFGTLSIPAGALSRSNEAGVLSDIGFANRTDAHAALRSLASNHSILAADQASGVAVKMATACAGACSVVRLYDQAYAGLQLPTAQRPPIDVYAILESNLAAYNRIYDQREAMRIQEAMNALGDGL